MCRKLIVAIFFVLILSLVLTSTAKANLVGWWKLDEGSGTTASDASGNGNNGTLNGDPQWVAGKLGGALEFDGYSDGTNHTTDPGNINWVSVDPFDVVGPGITLAAWIRPEGFDISDARIVTKQKTWSSSDVWWMLSTYTDGTALRMRLKTDDGGPDNGTTTMWSDAGYLEAGVWSHVAATYDGSEMRLYHNGVEIMSTNKTGTIQADPTAAVAIGNSPLDDPGGLRATFHGLIDDLRIYNSALSEQELLGVMQGGGVSYPLASGPTPADGAIYPDTWVNISWSPGDFAASHDIYLGDNFDDVNAGSESTFQGNQTGTFIVVGFSGFPFPDGLIPGTTYYWRIDEVNDTEPNSPWVGPVWSFSIPPKTAYAPDPANGAESVALDVQLSWTPGFGAKLHHAYFGDNFDDVNNATVGLPLGTTTFNPGPLELSKTYYWRVDEFDGIDTYKGEVWSFITQGAVGSPEPANGAVDVKQTTILTWMYGVFANSHQVYFGTDKDAVKNADTSSPEYKGSGNLGSESYDPGQLQWDTTYYWRIDEANNVNPDSPWTGPLWSFTTADFIVIEDFEDYNDYPPDEIWNTWIDGYGTTTNGSTAGHPDPIDPAAGEHYVETTIVHGGAQSMPLYYDNNFKYSEATMTLVSVRDWTEEGVGVLSLWFYGNVSNAAERMYVALNGSAVVYHGNPDAAQISTWTEWPIDLQEFAAQGVNLANVNTITIGFGDKNNLQAGGSGMVLFDDIRLYRPAQ